MKIGKSSTKKFQYKPLTSEYVQGRKNQTLSGRDSYVSANVKFFQPQSGDNTIRILPGTWEDAEGYGHEIFVHYSIGADKNGYLCLKHMKGEDCPICNERDKANATGDDDYARELRANKRVGVWVIDRTKEGDGPKFWAMPPTLERDMAALAINRKTNAVLQFANPDQGYDFSFTKQGKDTQTKYVGPQFDREPSPLSDDDTAETWLQYIIDNPIPSILVFHGAEHIAKQFGGGAVATETSEKPIRSRKSRESEPATPSKELPSWTEVHEMDQDELEAFAAEKDVDLSGNFEDLKAAANHVCESLGIEPIKPAVKNKLAFGKKEEPKNDLPTWTQVHEMDQGDLENFANEHNVDLTETFEDLNAAASFICEQLGIEEDQKPKAKPSLGSKLKSLKSKIK